MSVNTRPVEIQHDGANLEGVLAIDPQGGDAPRPAVLVAHAWAGRSPFDVGVAERLAGLGYVGFAMDLYGKGVLGQSKEENQAHMTPFMEDRRFLLSRLTCILDAVQALPEIDETKIACVGYCFGGLCVLDIARSGADIAGVASFHGLLGAPAATQKSPTIKAKVAAYHGWDDPMATPEDVLAFTSEMTAAGADWSLHAYGGVMHAFTNPAANDPDFGTVYNKSADQQSWASLVQFLTGCFA